MNRHKYISGEWVYTRPGWCTHISCERHIHPDNPKHECWDPKSPAPYHRFMGLERAQARLRQEMNPMEAPENGAYFRLMNAAAEIRDTAVREQRPIVTQVQQREAIRMHEEEVLSRILQTPAGLQALANAFAPSFQRAGQIVGEEMVRDNEQA